MTPTYTSRARIGHGRASCATDWRPPDSYAIHARVEGPLTAVLVILMLAGWVLARGRDRSAAGLLGWTTLVMALAPVALLFYSVRYATPMYGPLAAGAAIGLDQVIGLRRRT